jgi:hypothetical protein
VGQGGEEAVVEAQVVEGGKALGGGVTDFDEVVQVGAAVAGGGDWVTAGVEIAVEDVEGSRIQVGSHQYQGLRAGHLVCQPAAIQAWVGNCCSRCGTRSAGIGGEKM